MTSRRSFLALLAAALNLSEIQLGTPPESTPRKRPPAQYLNYTITDSIDLRPRVPVSELLFPSPLPASGILINDIRFYMDERLKLATFVELLDKLEFRFTVDKLTYLSGAVGILNGAWGIGSNQERIRQPLFNYPLLTAQTNAGIELAAGPLNFEEEKATVHFAISGLARVEA